MQTQDKGSKPTRKIGWSLAVFVLLVVALSSCKVYKDKADAVETEESTTVPATVVSTGSHNGHDYVDLGLSVKWATCNVGAPSPSAAGNYFAWGETSPKSDYSRSTSKWDGVSFEDLMSQGVINSSGTLTPQYDAAAAHWGGSWRMPTLKEIEELLNKCIWTWTQLDGKNGYKVTGPNGNSLFLPAGGYRGGSSTLYSVGSAGYYWSSTAYDDSLRAYDLDFDSSSRDLDGYGRYEGRPVRPVQEYTRRQIQK